MFVFTAKFNRNKAILMVLALAVLLCVIVLAAGARSSEVTDTGAFSAAVKNESDRTAYLRSLGWEVSEAPIEEQAVLIPADFSGVYSEYNELQVAQGFDLANYSGLEAIRYTYQVFNYPDCNDNIVADILVYHNEIIGGDIKSTALDGFIHGLSFPNSNSDIVS